jgi:hypothetical protein
MRISTIHRDHSLVLRRTMPKHLARRIAAACLAACTAALVATGCGNGHPNPGPTATVKPITLGVFKFKPVGYLTFDVDGNQGDITYGANTKAQVVALTAKDQQILSANISFARPADVGLGFVQQAKVSGAKVGRPLLLDLQTPPAAFVGARQRSINDLKAKGDVVTVFRSTEGSDRSLLTGVIVRHTGPGPVKPAEVLVATVFSEPNPGKQDYDANQQRLMYGLLASLKQKA